MTLDLKKGLYIAAIWLFPIALVATEAVLFLSRADWQSPYLVYFITFWLIRAALAPAIAYYTLRTWSEHKSPTTIIARHILGFILFTLAFWLIAYVLLSGLLDKNEFFGISRTSSEIGKFSLIVDNSVSTNVIVYVSTAGLCYVWRFFREKTIMHQKATELEQSLLTSRLELLKGQLNTHFLFNTLHTISSLVVRHQNEEANKMLIGLSELLRFSLKENKSQLIPIQKELELLKIYLDIQKVRFKDRLQFDIDMDPAAENCLIPSLLLQPLVENAVKYGIEPYSHQGRVNIKINRQPEKINLSVSDTGKKTFSDIDFNSGIGLRNTKDRLKQLYGDRHNFQIRSHQGGGVLIQIEIPA